MYSLYIKFQEKIFTGKRIIQLWNFGNFGIPEIIPKILVTLRFSKISLHELNGNYKCFKIRYWPHFYVDPTHSNTYFLKVGKWWVFLQGTVSRALLTKSFYQHNVNALTLAGTMVTLLFSDSDGGYFFQILGNHGSYDQILKEICHCKRKWQPFFFMHPFD